MNILYGIQLNGNGHLTRSQEVIKELLKRGHNVDIITSGGKSSLDLNLKCNITHFKGLDLFLNQYGSISWMKTIRRANLYRLIKDTNFDSSGYDLVISDFEPISAWSSIRSGVTSIGISNQYSLLNSPITNTKDLIYREFIRIFAPCDEYIGLDYTGNGDWIHSPIISSDLNKINKKIKTIKNSILVYLPNYDLIKQIQVFSNFPNFNFTIYSNEVLDHANNIEIKSHDRHSFIESMLKTECVITASGFTTTTESLFLGKKLWSIPTKGHYEQLQNSINLEKMGIFIEELSEENFNKWVNEFNKIECNWVNPINDIIKKIEKNEKN